MVTENEKTNLHNIINNYLQKDWGKSNILKTIKNHYYISQTINEKCPTLSKINEEDWIELVNNGIKFYGKLSLIIYKFGLCVNLKFPLLLRTRWTTFGIINNQRTITFNICIK